MSMINKTKYDFDEIIDRRHTNALNTDGFRSYIFHAGPEKKFKFRDEEFVRMWVADMEFAIAPEILDSIRARLDRKILGYTLLYEADYYQAFLSWCKERYDWSFPREELVNSPGIIPALYQILEDLIAKDEKVLTMTPAYGFFLHACEYNDVELVQSPLISNNGHFEIDFEDFEKKASDPKVKLLLLCNPHNPSGRIWTEEELKKIADVVEKNDLWVISDEIHCDIVRNGLKHIPLGKIMPEYKKLVTCMSASKTFNMAGLLFSNVIIRDEELRNQFVARDKLAGGLNPLSIEAHKAAYEKGGPWLKQLKDYLDGNFNYVKEFFNEYLPEAVFEIPEATYLAWVDMSKCLPEEKDLPSFFANEAGILLEGGNELFVGNAEGCVRLNLAMPRSVLETGMERMRDAIYKRRK
ncbi:MAG: PatB family C-S lyase [Firmicutes bacterium]|nr:PatB family C-S lyase [Bacillota bacterium]